MNVLNADRQPIDLFYRGEAALPAQVQLTPAVISSAFAQQESPTPSGSVRPFNERGEEITRLK